MTKKAFDPVLGRVPSGIFILTAGVGERATGMLSSWVMQAGFEPPMVSVGVKLGRYVCDWLTEGQPFVLNLVGESQSQLLKHFGKGFEPGERLRGTQDHALCPRRPDPRRRHRLPRMRADRATSTPATTASSWPKSPAANSTTPTPNR